MPTRSITCSQIVGQSCDINGNCRPFLWENGNMIDLNTLVPASQAEPVLSCDH